MKESRLTELKHLFKAYEEGRDELFQEILQIARIFEMEFCGRIKGFDLSDDSIEFEDSGVRFIRSEYDGIYASWFIPFEYFSLSDEELTKIAKEKKEKDKIDSEESLKTRLEQDILQTENKLKSLNDELNKLNK
jgi:hypothetical protein